MKFILYIFLFFSFCISLVAQERTEWIEGEISYLSANNIYVKFESTDGIEVGDSLFSKTGNDFIPVISVKFLSSKSAAGENITTTEIKPGDKIFARIPIQEETITTTDTTNDNQNNFPQISEPAEEVTPLLTEDYVEKSESIFEENISGKFSIKSYSNFTNQSSSYNYQRWRYTFRLNADHVGNSKISLSNYMIFSYRADRWNEVTDNLTRALKIYDLAVKYEFNDDTRFWIGRYLNRKISNISIVDGLQFEHSFSSFTTGIVAGSRPNFSDFGLNLKLFEYGVYLNKIDSVGEGKMENTLSVFQQTNNFKTDRRFIYLQHNNSIISKTSIFISSEMDLYKKELGQEKTELSLTSLYISTRVRPSRVVSFGLSYDARKNVIYYETFKTFLDSIIENETRQGFRFNTTVRPFNKLSFGFNFGYRFRESDVKPSRNFNANINYSSIPFIESSTGISFTRLSSSYLNGNIYGIRFSKSIPAASIDLSLGYRRTDYEFENGADNLIQNSFYADVSTRVFKPVYLNLGYEGNFTENRSIGRILLDLSARF